MAAKTRLLDVWLSEGNVVYKEVPFTVVIDWIQQGRLLEDDQVRISGTDKWAKIVNSRTLAAYLPKAEPFRVEDQAEALEPVTVDFSWKRPTGEEDDDPDMIPLIDISLVLLVFFMMTATVIVASTNINVPAADNALLTESKDTWWIGIEARKLSDGSDGPPAYSFGIEEKPPDPENRGLTEAEVVARVTQAIKAKNERVSIRIVADQSLPAEIVMNLTGALELLRPKTGPQYIRDIRAEVSEKRK